METYVMKNVETNEKITCYWYEAMDLKEKGWVEVEYIPDFNYALQDEY
jgi:hypothetical protein